MTHLSFLISFITSVMLTACNQTSFMGSTTSRKGSPKGGESPGEPTPPTTEPGTPDVKMAFFEPTALTAVADQIHRIWIVTTDGTATRLTVIGDVVTEKKVWTGILGSGGTRTYVTEGGFVAARFPNIYFIDPETTPEGPLPPESKKNIGATQRICLSSYQKTDKRYLMAVWGSGSFMEFLLSPEKPYKPLWDTPSKTGTLANITWGYSCFIDQKRKIFYSQHGGGFGAINLNTYEAVNPITTAPNASFASDNIPTMTRSVKPASYSMSGDSDGNVFNGTEMYTMAHDTATDSVWATIRKSAPNKIGVFPRSCLTSTKKCEGFAWYDSPDQGFVGPLSALKDGRIIGAMRTTGNIYILSLKNKSDRTAGINSVKIASLGKDPYMYTDFTGATLYMGDWEHTFKLQDHASFDASKPVEQMALVWKGRTEDSPKDLRDVKLETRCYKVTDPKKPDYEAATAVGSAGVINILSSGSCSNKDINQMDVKLTQLKGETTLEGVGSMQIAFGQR